MKNDKRLIWEAIQRRFGKKCSGKALPENLEVGDSNVLTYNITQVDDLSSDSGSGDITSTDYYLTYVQQFYEGDSPVSPDTYVVTVFDSNDYYNFEAYENDGEIVIDKIDVRDVSELPEPLKTHVECEMEKISSGFMLDKYASIAALNDPYTNE